MNQIRDNNQAPLRAPGRAALQISWGDKPACQLLGGEQTASLGPWAAQRYEAVMRAKPSGHDELISLRHISAVEMVA